MPVSIWILMIILNCVDIQAVISNCTSNLPEQNAVRLVGGYSESEGRVEVFRGDQWGTVCDDMWDAIDASVVCRQLGYSTLGAEAVTGAGFGQGSGPIHFDDVACTGVEDKLVNCRRNMNCEHDEDAGVRCFEGPYFMFGGRKLKNNSFILLSEIQESNTSTLSCVRGSNTCSVEVDFHAIWIAPNGSTILQTSSNSTLDKLYQNQSLVLDIPSAQSLTSGIYKCIISCADDKTDRLFIGITNSGLQIESVEYSREKESIFCVSTGGPITHTIWRKNDVTLKISDPKYEFSHLLIDGARSEFQNSIRFINKDDEDSGNYTCEVVNQNGSDSTSLILSTCKQDSVRLRFENEQKATLQVCFNDEWEEAEVINGIAVRIAGDLALGVGCLTPSHNSIDVVIDDTSMISVLIIECSSLPNRSDSVKHQHSAVHLPSMEANGLLKIVINGLQQQTQYQCCIKAISNLTTLSLVKSVRIKCESVSTLTSQLVNAVSGENMSIVITLGSVLGAASVVGMILASILIAICSRKSSCHYRLNRESLECSVMRENPLYQSADYVFSSKPKQTAVENHIYSNVLKKVEKGAETNHQYVDIELPRSQEPAPRESFEAINPLYATGESVVS